jgi:hypothetical protein
VLAAAALTGLEAGCEQRVVERVVGRRDRSARPGAPSARNREGTSWSTNALSTTSNVPSGNGSRSAKPCRRLMRPASPPASAARSRSATASIPVDASTASTVDAGQRVTAATASVPVPQPTSSTRRLPVPASASTSSRRASVAVRCTGAHQAAYPSAMRS